MAEGLEARQVESVAMESTGVYWIAAHEGLEAQGLAVAGGYPATGAGAGARQQSEPTDCEIDSAVAQLRIVTGFVPTPEAVCMLRSWYG